MIWYRFYLHIYSHNHQLNQVSLFTDICSMFFCLLSRCSTNYVHNSAEFSKIICNISSHPLLLAPFHDYPCPFTLTLPLFRTMLTFTSNNSFLIICFLANTGSVILWKWHRLMRSWVGLWEKREFVLRFSLI